MKFLKNMRKGKGSVAIVARTVFVALMVSFFFTTFAFSFGCGDGAKSVSKAAGCHDCCSMAACCSVKNDAVPAKPLPLGPTRETSSQEFVSLPAPALPRLHGFAFEAKPVPFSPLSGSPHYSTAPLAQGCIQLI
jgi:hypothetical protein